MTATTESLPGTSAPGTEVTAGPRQGEGAGPAGIPRVIGVDLSLVATGIASARWTETIRPPALPVRAGLDDHCTRLRWIRTQVASYTDRADLVVLEGFFGSGQAGAHERGALWWWVVNRCVHREIPLAVIQPATLKKYATGNGGADKKAMVAAARQRFPRVDVSGDDNRADALFLVAAGRQHLGRPLVELPDEHVQALDVVDWPEVPA